jgi:hypothetical protein
MARVPSPTKPVNRFSFNPDPHYNPLPVVLPDALLEPAPPPLDVDDFPTWRNTLDLLPSGRRRRLKNCRRNALHLRKHTERGSVETVNPIACGDRTACPGCAIKYAHERAWGAAQKLATISLTAQNFGVYAAAPLHVLQFKAVIPEWQACVAAKGCEHSEVIGRLCPATSGCIACQGAAGAHAGAAQVEHDMARWAVDAWTALRPDTGGVRHTTVRQQTPAAPIELIITLHVPAVAVKVFPGAKIEGARAQRISFQPVGDSELAGLCAGWLGFIQANYGATAGTMTHDAPTSWEEIWTSFRQTHAAPVAAWEAMVGESTAVLTPDVAATFARAAGLGAITASGKARRVQRTAWFGVWGGRHQTEAMHAVDIYPTEHTPAARAEVLDAVRLLHRGDTHTRCQSLRDGSAKLFPNEMVRWWATVDSIGRPTEDTTYRIFEYGNIARARQLSDVRRSMINLSLDAGSAEIALGSTMQSPPQSRQSFLNEWRVRAANISGAPAKPQWLPRGRQ